MNPDKLSAIISLLVSIVILGTTFSQWQDVTWDGNVILKKWAKFLLMSCLVALGISLLLLF